MKILSISVFISICLFVFLNQFVPESTCYDGWDSPSIGIQGACSYHGGVNDYGELRLLFVVLSLFLGFSLFIFLNDKELQKSLKKNIYKRILFIKKLVFSFKGFIVFSFLIFGAGFYSSQIYLFEKKELTKSSVLIDNNSQYTSDKDNKVILNNYSIDAIDNISSKYKGNTESDFSFKNNITLNISEKYTTDNINIQKQTRECGEGGRYSDFSGECMCDFGYGKGKNGMCETKECGEGGRYSDFSGECMCDFGYGKGKNGICETKECADGLRYNDLLKKCF